MIITFPYICVVVYGLQAFTVLYFISAPALWAEQGQYYSCCKQENWLSACQGFLHWPLRGAFAARGTYVWSGPLGPHRDLWPAGSSTGWPCVLVFSLHRASASSLAKEKWSPILFLHLPPLDEEEGSCLFSHIQIGVMELLLAFLWLLISLTSWHRLVSCQHSFFWL